MDEYEVVLEGGRPWGFRLQGGKGSTIPLRIAQVTPNSKASLKELSVGTQIIEINANDTKELTMRESQDLIKVTGNQLTLRLRDHVMQPVQPTDTKYVVMEGGRPWGMRLQGGKGTGKELQIGQVTPGSKAAEVDIVVGDEILSINDISTDQLSMMDAQNVIKETGQTLKLGMRINISHSQQIPSQNERDPITTPKGNVSSDNVKPPTNDKEFFDELINSMDGGREDWSAREAKGNTFQMLRNHMDAGQGKRVLTVFDVAPTERNKSIPTTAPKVGNIKKKVSIDDDGIESIEIDSSLGREIVMSGGRPWGIRLQGGKNSDSVLNIANVTAGSKAYNEGLLIGDHITSINNIDVTDLTMLQAQNLIKDTGDDLKLWIKRAPIKRLEQESDAAFFKDLKVSCGGRQERRGGGAVKGNAFKRLQHIVDSK